MEKKKTIIDDYLDQSDWRVNENASVDYSLGGLILHNSGALSANYWLNEVYPKEIADAHKNASFHIHDLSMIAGYCAGWSIKQLIKEGISGVEGKITSAPAKHLTTLVMQMVNFIGIMQNEWAGAQAFSSFDTYLSAFVKKDNMSEKEVSQCLQSFIFGLNTPSRWGCVMPTTEILTCKGWKKESELVIGEEILSYDMNKKEIVKTPLTEIIRKKNESGKMNYWNTKSYRQEVSEDHRCIVYKNNTEDLVIAKSGDLVNKKVTRFPISVNGENSNGIDLSDKAIKLAAKMKIIDKQFYYMNNRQANLFLVQWGKFDKHYKKFKLQCDNQDIVDAIQYIAILAGKTSHVLTQSRQNNKPTTYVKINKAKAANAKVSVKNYDGDVWCPNVAETGTAIFRDKDGFVFISGNCQCPFSNITLDWNVPNDLKDQKAIAGGVEQDFTYGECQKEMDLVNKCFIKLMTKGDAEGRGFAYPIPTYNITKDFDWDSENAKLLFEMTAQYGTPYFQNFINSDLNPNDVRSMCCRLQLDKRELRKRGGGLFGSDEFTGSIGVVTINLPQIGYLSETKEEFYKELNKLMILAKKSLIIKRKKVTELMEQGLYPYTKRYLKNFNNHFNTIGINGMHECCLNFLGVGLDSENGEKFANEVLSYMRVRLQDFQEETGSLFNLEATPAESTSYRLAMHDKKNYPGIITSGTDKNPFYNNSTQMPVEYTQDVFEALDHQDSLQTKYTGGTVFHTFLGESIKDYKACRDLVKAIAFNYKLPYFTISPTYSVCPIHGYLSGEHFECPKCKVEKEKKIKEEIVELEKQEKLLEQEV